ncbi:uncharacterized protein N7443_006168 [Penicillium atrosanguineum]|uniref:uncharacterized protein n=1 Tax=Penicillium atrosanguineum TaxID=1132637 RepID=UPI00238C0D04|nr:uncharacterized protein N7443_006168 [Penicillium atrosanguineum]KAJ5129051.1 hypothetical protein N7526_007217 [Penicillium atrosanguineum]KAJ5301166.1 hypothetical protein N7443_006168 [Penicillium atrosanguineum]
MSSSNDNYTIHKVSLKRTRQACAPCRRKKARCPGEKPACSLCQRLGQHCAYGSQAAAKQARDNRATSTHSQDLSAEPVNEVRNVNRAQMTHLSASCILKLQLPIDTLVRSFSDISRLQTGNFDASNSRRLQQIEQQLNDISGLLRDRLPQTKPSTEALSGYLPECTDQFQREHEAIPATADPSTDAQNASSCSPLPSSFVQAEVETYLSYFHDRPYCVFDKSWLLNNAYYLPSDIAYPLVALTCRLSIDSPGLVGRERSTGKDGKTGLSFLQGTFLNAQLDFADGNAHRGCASVAIGLRVIQFLGLNQDRNLSEMSRSEAEARRRITWAFFMLDRTYNASRSYSLCLSDNHFTLLFPSSSMGSSTVRASLHKRSTKEGHKVDQGIMACLVQLYALWGKATEWVFEPFMTSPLPPWQTGSALSILESEWMHFETQFADTHRYMNVDFKRRAREEPQSHPYLSSWLCVQFLFHSIQCLLHHPFVTMIKLRHMKGNFSATFLQKSFETSLIHSRWIARFIKEMAEVDMRLCDPFFGYLAAIAATIQLEHTENKNPRIALLLNEEYRILVGFMTELSSHWESMRILVNRVNELAARHQNYGSLFYNQDGFSGALSTMPTPSNLPRMSSEDESLMWDILDLTSSSFTQPASTARLAPGNEEPITNEPDSPGQDSDDEIPTKVQGQGSDTPNFLVQSHHTLIGEASHPVEEPSSDWPFSQRVSNNTLAAVPDIPDWMIFGDFTEHL